MSQIEDKPSGGTKRETVLLRLFRCMSPSEQGKLTMQALRVLAARCSLDPYYKLLSDDDLQEEIQSDDLDGRLMSSWDRWPGGVAVNLADLGDPGMWIEQELGEVAVLRAIRGVE